MCDVTQSKNMEPLLAIVWGLDMMRLWNHHLLSVCPLRWGIIFEILLRSSGVEWPTVTAAVVTFKDESALYVRAFFPTDNKLLASGDVKNTQVVYTGLVVSTGIYGKEKEIRLSAEDSSVSQKKKRNGRIKI
ncbi:hypothetical protein DAPPUDRAFT_97834 [Daphnia pulex]|uniref:Uncharacterized protein n=1 Tax=Daphnia pulex TaxID=6669 RepID=E9G2P9_DAPPU|nr:hypothetical protein DAPPUDRAFT_97834 [Daphnia pulex]|eukprot:EFX86474.1 hypothetical protein DAPPUDRAFT_97834 [Daphnia pulex]